MTTNIKNIYIRLKNWIDSPAMQPVKRFWLLSICLNSLLAILGLYYWALGKIWVLHHPDGSVNAQLGLPMYFFTFLLLFPFSPFIGLACFFIPIYGTNGSFIAVFPFIIYPFVLWGKKNKYKTHLIYIVPAIASFFGILWFMVGPSYMVGGIVNDR